jgi:hypothetical protein
MDDSERSYGYSEDIYHGRRGPGGEYGTILWDTDAGLYYPRQPHHQRSYEYGPEESLGQPEEGELSPEERALQIRGSRRGGGLPPEVPGRPYDYGRSGYGEVDSFTWVDRGPYVGRGPSGYQRPDARIHEDVCDRLTAHGEIDASRVEVRVDHGEVTLSGTVPDRRTKRLAEDVVDRVRGVSDVHNRLRLER